MNEYKDDIHTLWKKYLPAITSSSSSKLSLGLLKMVLNHRNDPCHIQSSLIIIIILIRFNRGANITLLEILFLYQCYHVCQKNAFSKNDHLPEQPYDSLIHWWCVYGILEVFCLALPAGTNHDQTRPDQTICQSCSYFPKFVTSPIAGLVWSDLVMVCTSWYEINKKHLYTT